MYDYFHNTLIHTSSHISASVISLLNSLSWRVCPFIFVDKTTRFLHGFVLFVPVVSGWWVLNVFYEFSPFCNLSFIYCNYIEAQLPAALVDIGDILIRITNFLKKSVVWSSNELQFSKWQSYSKSPQRLLIHTIFLLWQPFCCFIVQYYLFQM